MKKRMSKSKPRLVKILPKQLIGRKIEWITNNSKMMSSKWTLEQTIMVNRTMTSRIKLMITKTLVTPIKVSRCKTESRT